MGEMSGGGEERKRPLERGVIGSYISRLFPTEAPVGPYPYSRLGSRDAAKHPGRESGSQHGKC